MYLTGPTSASNCLYCFSKTYFSSRRPSISGCMFSMLISRSFILWSTFLLLLPASSVYFAIFSFALAIVGFILSLIFCTFASTSFICSASLVLIFVISRCTLLATPISELLAFCIAFASSSRSGFWLARN